MDRELSRRHALAALGVTSIGLAGCLDSLASDETGTSDDIDDSSDSDGGDTDVTGDEENGDSTEGENESEAEDSNSRWPAIETGELVSDFEDIGRWEPQTGRIEAAPDEARIGSQAAVLESDEETAGMSTFFPDGLDLEGWDTSLAVKAESVSRIVVEFIAPTRDERLTTVRTLPEGYDGWFRLDCGYEHKPAGEPDLSNVTRLNVVAVGPEDGPTRMVVDDLRRTEAVDNGKAILAFYDGRESHFDIAAEMLEERGWAGAVPVDPRRFGGQGRMDFDQLHELRDRGWDICSYPRGDSDLTEQSEDRQRTVVESLRDSLTDRGFADGSRHFFAPDWRRLTPTTHEVVRDLHETGFVFGSCPTGAPPTGSHTTPVIWGPALHDGVRRHINLCDQYRQLTVLRIPQIVEGDESSGDSMSVVDFEHLLDHLEHRGLDVITPSEMIDGEMAREHDSGEDTEMADGTILEAGESHSIEGDGSGDSAEFDLEESILVSRFSHDGDGDFLAEAVSTDGDTRDYVLANTNEAASGESVVFVESGTYRLEVDAEDTWSVDLEQPEVHSDDLASLPLEQSGSGPSFVGPLWADGDLRLVVTHDGDGPFVVDGYGADGHREQIVDQTGEFDSSRSYRASGAIWIDIDASGEWTLEVSEA